MPITTLILQAIYFTLPAYFANMAPVLVRKIKFFDFLAKPIDFGARVRKERLFGKNKTLRGLIFAVIFGIIMAYLQVYLYQFDFFMKISITDYSKPILIGSVMGFGAILGDLLESFVKRRLSIKSGQPFIPFDQTDFIIGAYLCIWPFWNLISGESILAIFLTSLFASFFLHILVNHLAYFLKIRKERW